ncbi:hypothetical protein TRFO_25781 [Tritrichomonas foetus]|uniref:Cell division control protein 24 OB domain-containing protein n=1 Tax=Tritrichomonas foetus TaxID=1144522 RepID=A0A1J4K939_9EUKA|nr:hypothetical protein TRFO_25781 [Tritrichomonas foetus]|eukprot:OHT06228.1 hypothetical protein TRFO_25781 [Tritrichomonas foetus]
MNRRPMFHHMLDLQSFMDEENENISSYLTGRADSYSDSIIDSNWTAEQILLLFEKWTTGITRTILRQDVLNQSRTSRSRQHVKPDSMHQPVLHGKITEIGLFEGNSSAIIHIQQDGYDLLIIAAVHGALEPFLKTFIAEGRSIHFANIRFSNEYLIPNQLCVIDLKKTKTDIDFVISSTQNTSLRELSEEEPPNALLLRVEAPTERGIIFTDGEKKVELYLDEDRKPLKLLLRFGDVIVFYQPWVRELTPGIKSLIYGPNSVMFRVPVTVNSSDPLSQISQHASHLSQDGLLFRNSAACRSLRGTVLKIEHVQDSGKWSSSITIFDSDDRNVRINIKNGVSPYEVMRVVSLIRPNHYVWIFGLIELSNNILSFTSETAIFNTSLLHSIVASNIVIPKSLSIISEFTTFVARASIIKVNCELRKVHKTCQTLVSYKNCSTCKAMIIDDDLEEEFLFKLEIDDSSCDPVTVYGNGSKFPFWSIKPVDWKKADETKKGSLISKIIGKEYIFVLSLGNEQEFCGFGDDTVWRVDQCIRPVGDVEREVRMIRKFHEKLDVENNTIIDCE